AEAKGEAVVTWSYQHPEGLAGFRVLESGEALVDEARLAPAARRWADAPPPLASLRTYRYQLVAVTAEGVLSDPSEPAELTLRAGAVRERAPQMPAGLVAEWVADARGLVARLQWAQPLSGDAVDRYLLEVADVGSTSFRSAGELPKGTSFD